MSSVAVVDYGLCNLDSVRRAFEECGATVTVTDDPRDLAHADRIVLPGVGAFGDAMRALRESGFEDALSEEVHANSIPFLGICLGMHLVASVGFEGGDTKGLGWIDGEVRRFVPATAEERIPHVGWNEVDAAPGSTLFAGIPAGADFYFVHSYHFVCDDDSDIAATTPYCGTFTSALERENVFAVQFHPEKSQRHGFQLLRNVLAC
jgi:glutamine amidotransferase